MNERIFVVEESDRGKRLDVYISEILDITRSHVKILNEGQFVRIDGEIPSKCGRIIKTGEVISVSLPEPKNLSIEPENIPLDIIYEDDSLAVINKQKNLVVHPAQGSESGTLVNALLYHLSSLSSINGVIRPGIVHRLDKDTTGLIVVAKDNEAHISLSSQIASKTCKRIYLALVEGNIDRDTGTIDAPIARMRNDRKKMCVDPQGRRAVTDYKVIARFKRYTLLQFELHTGRTHQIRVHAKHIGHPVVGDKAYNPNSNKFGVDSQMLHATRLSFVHPKTKKEMTFDAPLPDYFANIINSLD